MSSNTNNINTTISPRLLRLHNFYLIAKPICQEYTYPIGVLLTFWVLESNWGKQLTGANNFFKIRYLYNRKAYGKQSNPGWSWNTTIEYLTKPQFNKIPAKEAERIKQYTFDPISNKYKILMERRYINYLTIEDCIIDKIYIIKYNNYYYRAYSRWLSHRDDEQLLKEISNYSSKPDYYNYLLRVYRLDQIQQYLYPKEKENIEHDYYKAS